MSEVVRRAGIFCARQYQEIVEELLAFWKIDAISGLSAIGRQAQEKLKKIPARLARMADFQDAKSAIRDFGFDFIYGRSEEHTSELQSLMRISYAVFCLK